MKISPKHVFFYGIRSPKNVFYGRRYIRNSLYPVCAKSGMGFVIVEGDSLVLFTALKFFQGTLYPVYVTAYKICL